MLIDALISLGCLQQEEIDKFRPVVKLTEFGDEVMRAKTKLQNPLPIPAQLFHKIHGGAKIISESPQSLTKTRPSPARAKTTPICYRP